MSKNWRFLGNEAAYVQEVLDSGFSAGATGTMNERLEKAFAQAHGLGYAVTANSGTSTLHMALHAFGVNPGDEVLVPALAPAMCGFCIWQAGAIPVYVDVREDTFLMDPEDVKRKITPKTKAMVVVHLYGLMCDMQSLEAIAKAHGLFIVEDCAQCLFGTDDQGRLAGTVGDVGSWSFENSKHISTGDGGAVATDNPDFAEKMRRFGGVGFKNLTATSGKVRIDKAKFQDPNWERHTVLAYNYRLPEICAAVGLAQLEQAHTFVDLRAKMGEAYVDVIKKSKGLLLTPQYVPPGYFHSYYTFGALYHGDKLGIPWQEFRRKYVEFGGDGIYAAWQTINNEPCFKDPVLGWGNVPVAEKIQKQLMQFTANQKNEQERQMQAQILEKTLAFFEKDM